MFREGQNPSDFGDDMMAFGKKSLEEQSRTHKEADKNLPDSNIVEFPGNKKIPERNTSTMPPSEVLINPQMLKVVGVKKRVFDPRKYQGILLDGFNRALEMTKEEAYSQEIPLDESAKLVDNILEKLFAEEISNDHKKNAALLLRAENDKSVDPKELSQAASYFVTLKFQISQAKSALMNKMIENYRQTRIDIRGKSPESKLKIREDVANVEQQIRDIVEIKSDQIVAKSLGLKSLEELDRVIAMAEQVQNLETEEALKEMSK